VSAWVAPAFITAAFTEVAFTEAQSCVLAWRWVSARPLPVQPQPELMELTVGRAAAIIRIRLANSIRPANSFDCCAFTGSSTR
jgi:hypothetical protein